MQHKSLRTCVLLLGLLLGTTSSAYADAIAISNLTFTNLQITPAVGSIQFGTWQATASSVATNSLGGSQTQNSSSSGATAQSTASVQFADASGNANTTNQSAQANTSVQVSGCTCSANAVQRASLSNTFVLVGGTGNVNVTISGILDIVQSVVTDEFGVMAEAEALFDLAINGTLIFSHSGPVLSIGRNSSDRLERTRLLSETITLQFNTEYRIAIGLGARSTAANEIPEPATLFLLVSGLGFMAGVVKTRRNRV